MEFPLIFNDGRNYHDKLGANIARTITMTGNKPGGTCPSECTLMYNGCYAQSGPSNFHALRSQRVMTNLREKLLGLRKGMKVRHNVSGDFYKDDIPDADYLREIKEVAYLRPDLQQYSYTHGAARLAEYKPNELPGLTINASCESFQEVLDNTALGYPCTLVMHADDLPKQHNEDGTVKTRFETHTRMVKGKAVEVTKEYPVFLPMVKRDDMVLRVCPNLNDPEVKCSDCMLCFKKGAQRTRKNAAGEAVPLVVLFPLHGNGQDKAAKAIALKKGGE